MISRVIQEDVAQIVDEFKDSLSTLDGKTVLVTGANGMIPSYIVDVIAEAGKSFSSPPKLLLYNKNPTTPNSRLGHLLSNPDVTFFSCDVGKPFEVPTSADIILHAASRANPLSFKSDPIDTLDANVTGTRTLLEYAAKRQIEQFILFSSSEVYGNPPAEFVPTAEDYFGNVNCLGDMACYAEAKRFSETLCMAFFKQHHIPVKILRIFQTLGPGLRNDGKTLANMFATGIKGGKITLKDPGLSRRSYGYVGDTARGILKVMFSGKAGEAYNIGDDTNYASIREVAEIVRSLLSLESSVECPQQYDLAGERIQNRSPNITKLRQLGFEPKTCLEESLRRTRDYYLEAGI